MLARMRPTCIRRNVVACAFRVMPVISSRLTRLASRFEDLSNREKVLTTAAITTLRGTDSVQVIAHLFLSVNGVFAVWRVHMLTATLPVVTNRSGGFMNWDQ